MGTTTEGLPEGTVDADDTLVGTQDNTLTRKFIVSAVVAAGIVAYFGAGGAALLLRSVTDGTYAYVDGTENIDLSAAARYEPTNALGGNTTFTGTNADDDYDGRIIVKQDGTGGRTVAFTVTGATMLDLGGGIDPDPDAESYVAYDCYTAPTTGLTCAYWMAPDPDATGVSDGDKGDITVSSSGAAWAIDDGTVGLPELADSLETTRVFRPWLPSGGTIVGIEGRAYAVYMGYAQAATVIKHVECTVGSGGTGAQTAEVALASSPLAPNKSTQTLTHLVSDGTLGDLTTNGVRRNTTAFSAGAGYTVAAGTHWWALVRTAMATNEPTWVGVTMPMGHGYVMRSTDDSIGALTSMTTYSFVVITGEATTVGPYCAAVMD